MGRTGKWFRALLGSKKSSEPAPPATEKKKGKWALAKSADKSAYSKNVENPSASPYVEGLDASKHAIAVAAATAAVAEAALAAAQAAAEVVRLTSGSGSSRNSAAYANGDRRRAAAAVKIQSAFRAYLARRALRALKGLVKLQALVRGHIVRKHTTNMLRRMQAMARIQARASAHRAYVSESSAATLKFTNSRHPGNQRKFEHRQNTRSKHDESLFLKLQQHGTRPRIGSNVHNETSRLASNWLDHWMEQNALHSRQQEATAFKYRHGDDDRSDKILEIDTWKPHQSTTRNDRSFQNLSAWNGMEQDYSKTSSYPMLSTKLQQPNPSVSSEEVSSVTAPNFTPQSDQTGEWTGGEISPRLHSVSSRPTRGMVTTPMKTDCSRSLFGDYLTHPNYMANTESSRAKVRSQSVPKQRLHLEELGANAKFGHHLWESDAYSEKGSIPSRNYTNLNPSHLKRPGVSNRGLGGISFNSTYGHT